MLFTAKLDYALRALLELALQPPGRPVQCREIARRQQIPEQYLNQVLVVLRQSGLVRSLRGAHGGYVLGKDAARCTVAEVRRALQGEAPPGTGAGIARAPSAWVVQNLQERIQGLVQNQLEQVTLADLKQELDRLDESQSLMVGL